MSAGFGSLIRGPCLQPLRGIDPALRAARLAAARGYPPRSIVRRAIIGGHWDGGELVRSRMPPRQTPEETAASLEAALAARAGRREAHQARARKGAATRMANRIAGDRLAGAAAISNTIPNPGPEPRSGTIIQGD